MGMGSNARGFAQQSRWEKGEKRSSITTENRKVGGIDALTQKKEEGLKYDQVYRDVLAGWLSGEGGEVGMDQPLITNPNCQAWDRSKIVKFTALYFRIMINKKLIY